MAYVGKEPWHKLGNELPKGQPIEVWIKAARLDWELRRLPVQFLLNGALRIMPDRFVLTRSDTDAALSVVSGDYQIVQPKEVLEFFRGLVDLYGYTLETAGALNGGRKFWALGRTGKSVNLNVGGGRPDEIAAYLLLATSCDKTLATTAAFTSVRVVCANTLGFAMDDVAEKKRRHVKVFHTQYFDPMEVKEQLGVIDKAWEAFLAGVRRMTEVSMPSKQAPTFFERVLKRQEGKPLSPRARNEHNTLLQLFTSAPGQQLATAKETLWGAVNTVTYYVDHVRRHTIEDRLDSAWFGAGNLLKQKAWDLATQIIGAAGKTEKPRA
jgi:phage/plasmid-like protein (TIGR03299 family)